MRRISGSYPGGPSRDRSEVDERADKRLDALAMRRILVERNDLA